jgi:holo-[acyl-carrier protein] synthase
MQEVAVSMSRKLPSGVRLGFDLVQVSQIAHSVECFGAAFQERLFTRGEQAYAQSRSGVSAERLAARFAAKEAVIKALQLSDAGIGWRDIEVVKREDGDCELQLHGRVAALAAQMGVDRLLLSLSHDGDYAGAMVMAFSHSTQPEYFLHTP